MQTDMTLSYCCCPEDYFLISAHPGVFYSSCTTMITRFLFINEQHFGRPSSKLV